VASPAEGGAQTEADATRFAFTVVNKYNFGGDAADRYQTICAWLLRDMSLRRGLPD
jgi:hypothetical protein